MVRNVPSGLGGPVFDKLEADLAKACMSIPAAKGFEVSLCLKTDYITSNKLQGAQVGSGFSGTLLIGSQHNDEFVSENTRIR